jgi:hypothetical protein
MGKFEAGPASGSRSGLTPSPQRLLCARSGRSEIAYAAIGVPGISRKFGGPDFARGSVQFGDNFNNDRITDSRRFEAGDPPQIVSVTGSICRKSTYDELRG